MAWAGLHCRIPFRLWHLARRMCGSAILQSSKGSLISRIHARIEIARNKALLVDQSTNGSFVTTQDGKEAFVRRDSVALAGSGAIGLGKLPEQNSPDAILYRLEE